jgi:hypothetical protein
MLDLTAETPIPLEAACRLIPPARGAKRCHLSTLVRWIHTGVRAPDGQRVRLEAIRLGARWCTSREAIQRFAEALTPHLDTHAALSSARTPRQARRASERAGQELAESGA